MRVAFAVRRASIKRLDSRLTAMKINSERMVFLLGIHFNVAFMTDSKSSLDAMVDLVRDNSSSPSGSTILSSLFANSQVWATESPSVSGTAPRLNKAIYRIAGR